MDPRMDNLEERIDHLEQRARAMHSAMLEALPHLVLLEEIFTTYREDAKQGRLPAPGGSWPASTRRKRQDASEAG